jgi:hypothetical protein
MYADAQTRAQARRQAEKRYHDAGRKRAKAKQKLKYLAFLEHMERHVSRPVGKRTKNTTVMLWNNSPGPAAGKPSYSFKKGIHEEDKGVFQQGGGTMGANLL